MAYHVEYPWPRATTAIVTLLEWKKTILTDVCTYILLPGNWRLLSVNASFGQVCFSDSSNRGSIAVRPLVDQEYWIWTKKSCFQPLSFWTYFADNLLSRSKEPGKRNIYYHVKWRTIIADEQKKRNKVIRFYLKHNSTKSPQLENVARNSNAQLRSD